MKDHPRVEVGSRAAWRKWLAAHHGQAGSIWLVYGRKGHPGYLTQDDIVEEALAFGWIDSLPRKLDEKRTMLLLSPRQAASSWSAVNKRRAARMIAAGAMTAAGQAKIDAAKADGSWTRLDAVDALTVPGDLAAAFTRHGDAAANFAGFPPSTRRGILEWLGAAKREATRAKRIEETARLAGKGERANQWKRG